MSNTNGSRKTVTRKDGGRNPAGLRKETTIGCAKKDFIADARMRVKKTAITSTKPVVKKPAAKPEGRGHEGKEPSRGYPAIPCRPGKSAPNGHGNPPPLKKK